MGDVVKEAEDSVVEGRGAEGWEAVGRVEGERGARGWEGAGREARGWVVEVTGVRGREAPGWEAVGRVAEGKGVPAREEGAMVGLVRGGRG